MTDHVHELHRSAPRPLCIGGIEMIDTKELRLDAKDANGWLTPMEISGTDLIELLDRLEAAEGDIALKESIIDSLGSTLNAVANERAALHAKIEAMEQQEPFDADSDVFRSAFEAALKAGYWPAARQGDGYRSPSTQIAWRIAFSTVNRLKLYLAPGAKGE